MQDTDGMISIGGRWWCSGRRDRRRFVGGEWRSDGELRLHDSIGNVVEGRELSEAEVEQLCPRDTVG
jgi:hypothetical protein